LPVAAASFKWPAPLALLVSPRRGLIVTMATLCVFLVAAVALKAPCVFEPSTDSVPLGTYCHSDIVRLWEARGLDEDALPYVEVESEYPPVTAAAMWFSAVVTETLPGFFFVNVMILIAAAYGATLAVWRAGAGLPKIMALSASAALIAHAMTAWDLLAVAMAAIGWMRWREGDAPQAALFFGLGGATMVFPALFLPFILAASWRARDAKSVKRIITGGLLGLGLPNLLVMLFAFDAWVALWRYHLVERAAMETPWWLGVRLGMDPAVGGIVGLVALAAVVGLLTWRVWTAGLNPLVAGGLAVIGFLLLTNAYAPQYTLWVLPLLVLFDIPWGRILAFTAADVAVFMVRAPLVTPPDGGSAGAVDVRWEPWLMVAVVARWAALAAVAWWAWQRYGRPGSSGGVEGDEEEAHPDGPRQDIWADPHPEP
jgi:hypothetical protein